MCSQMLSHYYLFLDIFACFLFIGDSDYNNIWFSALVGKNVEREVSIFPSFSYISNSGQ